MDCILVSLRKEIDLFLDLLKNVKKKKESGTSIYEGELNGKGIRVLMTGIGKKNPGVEGLRGCTRIISTGFCGALVPDLNPGDIFMSVEILSADSDYLAHLFGKRTRASTSKARRMVRVEIDIPLFEQLACSLEQEGVSFHKGRAVTADRIIKTRREKVTLHRATGALSVEMEDFHRYCIAQDVSAHFLSIRSVLDSIEDEIPGFKRGFRLGSDLSNILRHISIAQIGIAVALEKTLSLRLPNFP
jgi:nucleoside phosphorylase